MSELLQQFEEVRVSGRCNMHDRKCVRAVAIEMGLDRLVEATETVESYAALVQSYDPEEVQ